MELLIETTFLSELLQGVWFRRHQAVDVMHSTVDAFGYDVVLQCDDVVRHVQLKAKKRSSRTSRYANRTPSCASDRPVAWCALGSRGRREPHELDFLWYGSGPRDPLPELLGVVSKHSHGNSQGVKWVRASMRDVELKDFDVVSDTAELCDRLFGSIPTGEKCDAMPD